MNYAVVILAFVFALSTGYWYIAGRKYYRGPRVEARVVDGHVVEGVVWSSSNGRSFIAVLLLNIIRLHRFHGSFRSFQDIVYRLLVGFLFGFAPEFRTRL